jgi:FkbM family methyltransferase
LTAGAGGLGLRARLGGVIARHRRSLVVRKLAGLSRTFLQWYENLDYDMARNGEAFVLRALAPHRMKVLLDVGANVGEWTRAAKAAFPDAQVHAFEISEPTWQRLHANVGALPGVHCVNFGLAEAERTITLRHYDELPALTTASDYPHPFTYRELPGKTLTGDGYLASQGVGHVDFLKIDVEGMEREVLAGFQASLDRGAIDVVQFEYGRVNILTKALLRDFHAFFAERGYAVGKMYPNYVDFREYDLADEDFLGPNYLACRRERADYLRALGGS